MKSNPNIFESYLQQLYAEQARIQELDRQRHTTFSDLVQLPWIGNFVS